MNARSYLFVPADRQQRFAKALASGADAVIIDLEDAVAPAHKDTARDTLAQWLVDPGSDAGVVVRVNGADSPWFDADLALVLGSPRVAAVMLPKADGSSPWHRLAAKPVLALVETAAGIEALDAVARAQPVRRLAFGSVDLQLDLGIDGDDDALLYFRRASSWRRAWATCRRRWKACALRSTTRPPSWPTPSVRGASGSAASCASIRPRSRR